MAELSRRHFLATASALSGAPFLKAQNHPEPIFDIHQHVFYLGRSNEELIAHQTFNGVILTNLLPGDGWMLDIVGGNADCVALEAQYPHRFTRFVNADPAESRMLDIGLSALDGSIPTIDSRKPALFGTSWPPPSVKLLAFGLGRRRGQGGTLGIGELKFHVLVDSPEMDAIYKTAEEYEVPVLLHFEYERFNLGIKNLGKVLKKYPKVNFIGHAQTWWANIGADLNPKVLYPKGPIKPGGLTDRLLSDYPNIFGDLSASSGLNAMRRDPEFFQGFIKRHTRKLIWGSDCECRDGKGGGTHRGYCVAAEGLANLRKLAPDQAVFRRLTYENGTELLKLKNA